MIAAFVAFTAIGAEFQAFDPFEPVEFNSSLIQVGLVNASLDVFTCPSTALYFVHYRILVVNGDEETCIFSLVVGQDATPVSYVNSSSILTDCSSKQSIILSLGQDDMYEFYVFF